MRASVFKSNSKVRWIFSPSLFFVGCGKAMRSGARRMASKSVARSLLMPRCLPRCSIPALEFAVSKSPAQIFTARRQASSKSRPYVATSARTLFTSTPTRYATVEEPLDFGEQGRESDEVDVCIVGGGKRATCLLTDTVDLCLTQQVLAG